MKKIPKLSSITKLFSTKKKRPPPQKRQPDEYYKQLWLPHNLYDDIKLVTELEKTISDNLACFFSKKDSKNIWGR
jgi:hypothetical protein